MSEWSFVAAAFGLTWAVGIGYAIYLAARVRRARRALENVEGGRDR